jgi:hypothetical protein
MLMIMVIHLVILLKNDLDLRKFQYHTENMRYNILVLQKAHKLESQPDDCSGNRSNDITSAGSTNNFVSN